MDVAQEPRAELSPSAHVDTFCRNSLPPADQWPDLRFTLPELSYPQRLNCADALLSGPDADRRCLVGRDYPAMAGIGVARLWDAEAVVELQGAAVLP